LLRLFLADELAGTSNSKTRPAMAKTTLNSEGESAAHALIRAGHYDTSSAWSFDAADGDKLLGRNGDDWDKFGSWHLGEDPAEPRDTKAHWKYPYGKDGLVYRRAVAAIRSRASQNGDDTVFEAAGRLMAAMDAEEGKKESSMSVRTILGSRFGHFAGGAAPAAIAAAAKPPEEPEDDEAKRAKAAEDEEARRKAEEEEAAEAKRRARRARRSRRAKDAKQQEDEEDDDAADDDEDEEDEEEMKRAATAGHTLGLAAAFRLGARAQRRRCGAIMAAPEAATNLALAASLAFETPMTAAQAIAVLKKTPVPVPARGSLAERMAGSAAASVRVGPGMPEAPKGPAAIAAAWDDALKPFAPAS
jgi:hypothetical protein